MIDPLLAISPLDGRYREKVEGLSQYFSEFALIRYRLQVEMEWFIFLCSKARLEGTDTLSKQEETFCRSLYENFTVEDAKQVKDFEAKTNHDVKALEYFIKERFKTNKKLLGLSEFIHFGCTSEDINNVAYGLIIRDFGSKEFAPILKKVIEKLLNMAKKYADSAMLGHTHGQPASPTTMGKELINFVSRLDRLYTLSQKQEILVKFNGAVGNWNAHTAAYPEIDWQKLSIQFLNSFDYLSVESYTTQIEPHDYLAEIFDHVSRINTVFLDLSRDMWMYISMGYFKQLVKAGEVGSSTMPHKVNPIDFENAEGNLGLANSLFRHFSEKLPISRLQRDLSDSTVLRNIGTAFGYSVIAYKSLLKGLDKLELDKKRLLEDLHNNYEVLAEAIQTILRKHKISGAYEKLKNLTRGKKLTDKEIKAFIAQLKIPGKDKKHLLSLTPETYTGLAEKLVKNYKRPIS